MRTVIAAFILAAVAGASPTLGATDPLAPDGLGPPPPPPPSGTTVETFYGQAVPDRYRSMEALDPGTLAWMKAQGAYTRAVLDHIGPLAALEGRVSAFTGSYGAVSDYAAYGGRQFYEERAPGADDFNLVVSDARGKRTLVDVAALRASHGGAPYAINWTLPSPDGTKIAVGVSAGGSEDAVMTIYDAETGRTIGAPIDRARFGATSWSPDSQSVAFIRLRALKPGEPGTETYKNARVEVYELKNPPRPIVGAGVNPAAPMPPEVFPAVFLEPRAAVGVLFSINGVQNERKIWTAPISKALDADAPWRLLADRSDGITDITVSGDRIFLLSHDKAPTFKVLEVDAGAPLSTAKVVVADRPDKVVESISAASDALYVLRRSGAYSELLRAPADGGPATVLPLPFRGHAGSLFTDPRVPGAVLSLSSWTRAPVKYAFDPATGRFRDLRIGAPGDLDAAAYRVEDLNARAADGVEVPQTLIRKVANSGAGPTVVEAYGSYGISELADFSSRRAAMFREGVNYSVCHVRGGGELGEAWRLGGKDANKPNTWRDLIACAQDLVARGVTTPKQLFILGGSAGGITMGRAMEERPDLFAGVIDIVPSANPLREEFSPNGPPNIPEFGTVTTEAGFKNLYAMDSVAHVQPGVAYPAILISTGLNDPRVAPWGPAKLAASLEAAGDPNPVLLRIDAEAGHGIGSTRSQGDRLTADWIAFVFWRSGRPDWRPQAAR